MGFFRPLFFFFFFSFFFGGAERVGAFPGSDDDVIMVLGEFVSFL